MCLTYIVEGCTSDLCFEYNAAANRENGLQDNIGGSTSLYWFCFIVMHPFLNVIKKEASASF
jgi:hypothetical protein